MGAAIGTDEPRAVNHKAHGQVLDRDIVHDLIIGALEECGVYRDEGFKPLCGEAACECDGVLFGDADIEHAVGIGVGRIYPFLCHRAWRR